VRARAWGPGFVREALSRVVSSSSQGTHKFDAGLLNGRKRVLWRACTPFFAPLSSAQLLTPYCRIKRTNYCPQISWKTSPPCSLPTADLHNIRQCSMAFLCCVTWCCTGYMACEAPPVFLHVVPLASSTGPVRLDYRTRFDIRFDDSPIAHAVESQFPQALLIYVSVCRLGSRIVSLFALLSLPLYFLVYLVFLFLAAYVSHNDLFWNK
jgi:hypothetical protein